MIDFSRLRELESVATPGPWAASPDGASIGHPDCEAECVAQMANPHLGNAAFLALARNLYLPLLDVASEAQELLTETEQLVAEHTPAGDAWMDLNRAFAALAEAVEREK